MDFVTIILSKFPDADRGEVQRYVEFVTECSVPPTHAYTEQHHVLPKSIWPEFRLKSDYPLNQKRLTAANHFVAHHLLWKALPACPQVCFAWRQMWCDKYGHLTQELLETYAEDYAKARDVLRIHRSGVPLSLEARAKMSKAKAGRTLPESTRKKMSEAKRGHVHSEETKAKIRATNKGQKRSPECCARMSAARLKQAEQEKRRAEVAAITKKQIEQGAIADPNRPKRSHWTPEAKARMSELRKGKKLSEEHRRKISEGGRGRRHTPETKAKLSAIKTGMKYTPWCDEARERASKDRKGRKMNLSPEARKARSERTRQMNLRRAEEKAKAAITSRSDQD